MPSPLRILQIIPSISLVYGGPSQMVLGLSKGLAAQNIDVTILTTNSNGDVGQPPLDVPLDLPVLQDGYQIRYFRCFPFRRYKFSPSLLSWLAHHAHEYDLAHIHALFSPLSTAAATIARTHCLPYILRPLGTLDPADLQKKKHLKRLYAALFERANLAGASALHFTSDQEAKISHRFGTTTRDIILPLGVTAPVSALPTHLPTRSLIPTILFMSRLDRKKGLDLLLPALQQLRTEGIEFDFILAGANPQDRNYENQIHHAIKTSTLADCTTIAGFVTGEAKAKLLQAADVFVLPSYYENFGIAVAEAMVNGLPVVISDQVHIWREIEQANAGWICACTVDSLTDRLRVALQDVRERQRRGNNAQTYAQTHYSWDAIAQQMIQIYRNLLAG
ncbi:MAG TPA: hormogonium polysaccharide biosynthesis glycosyltransferase HpsP [Allocoleopsis sp.]